MCVDVTMHFPYTRVQNVDIAGGKTHGDTASAGKESEVVWLTL